MTERSKTSDRLAAFFGKPNPVAAQVDIANLDDGWFDWYGDWVGKSADCVYPVT